MLFSSIASACPDYIMSCTAKGREAMGAPPPPSATTTRSYIIIQPRGSLEYGQGYSVPRGSLEYRR